MGIMEKKTDTIKMELLGFRVGVIIIRDNAKENGRSYIIIGYIGVI